MSFFSPSLFNNFSFYFQVLQIIPLLKTPFLHDPYIDKILIFHFSFSSLIAFRTQMIILTHSLQCKHSPLIPSIKFYYNSSIWLNTQSDAITIRASKPQGCKQLVIYKVLQFHRKAQKASSTTHHQREITIVGSIKFGSILSKWLNS